MVLLNTLALGLLFFDFAIASPYKIAVLNGRGPQANPMGRSIVSSISGIAGSLARSGGKGSKPASNGHEQQPEDNE